MVFLRHFADVIAIFSLFKDMINIIAYLEKIDLFQSPETGFHFSRRRLQVRTSTNTAQRLGNHLLGPITTELIFCDDSVSRG